MDNPFSAIDKRLNTIETFLLEIRQQLRAPSTPITSGEAAPILSAKQVKEMTGWPDGTFYAKVAAMPDGVVIRGKSKRLLFDREKFMQWLKSPVEA